MPVSTFFKTMSSGFKRLDKTFLSFSPRHAGDYTVRQLSMAAAYTIFCHGEIEAYMEGWATAFTDLAETSWRAKKATRPLVHLCTFHEGRKTPQSVPAKDIWNEVVFRAIAKQRGVIANNHGIKEQNICELLSPLGFDLTAVDGILLNDLSAFGTLRGQHAHSSHKAQIGTTFDPFDRRSKVRGLETLMLNFDNLLSSYMRAAK